MTAMPSVSDKPVEHVARAFVIAPLVSVATLVVTLVALPAALADPHALPSLSAALLMMAYAFMIGIPIAYAIAFLVCLPIYRVLRKNGTLSRGTVVLCAVMIAVATTIIGLGIILGESSGPVFLLTALMTVSAITGALTFWHVAFGGRGI